MTKLKKENFVEKNAWILFVIIGILIVAGGIPHMLGINTDPKLVESIGGDTIEGIKSSNILHFNLYDFYFRSGGLSDLGVAFFMVSIAIFAYRKGEKWSWFVLWGVPAFFIAYIAVSLSLPTQSQKILIPPLVVLTTISLLGLLLPIRKYFSKKLGE